MYNCCVSGCKTVEGETGKSFFRFPKDPFRCEQWKRALGFIANHRYSNLTPQQCFARLRLCSFHFEDNNFVGLHSKSACPSLNLQIANVNIDKLLLMPIKAEKSNDAQIQLTELQQENADIDKLLLIPIKVEKTEEGNESFCAQVQLSGLKQENFDIDELKLKKLNQKFKYQNANKNPKYVGQLNQLLQEHTSR